MSRYAACGEHTLYPHSTPGPTLCSPNTPFTQENTHRKHHQTRGPETRANNQAPGDPQTRESGALDQETWGPGSKEPWGLATRGGGHWRVRDHNVTPNMTNIRSLGGTRVFFLGGGGGDEGSPPGSNSGSALPGFWSFTCIFVPCEYCEGEQKEKQVLLHTSVCFMQGQCTMLLSRNYSQTARTEAT